MSQKKVLITGITGFLGSHTAIQLLEKGYVVRGTLRNMSRKDHIKQVIANKTQRVDKLEFVTLNLEDPLNQWLKAMEGIDFVMHVASPFPTTLPKNDDEVVNPAKEGTLNLLKAATESGIKRVVITSSSGAAFYGVRKQGVFNENDWTDVKNTDDSTPYFRSKTIAEQAAWNYVQHTNGAPELVTVLPGAILGPVLEEDFGTSANIVKKMMDGSMPAVPKIGFDMVDVRSVAEAHIKAMKSPKAAGQRYLCSNGYLTFKEVTQTLKKYYPDRKIPTKTLPDFMVRLFSHIDKETKPILLDLGSKRVVDNSKIKTELDWRPISLEKSIRDCAQSMLDLNII